MSLKKSFNVKRQVNVIFAIGIAGLFLFPFLWMISTSLKTFDGVYSTPNVLFPDNPQYQNYVEVFIRLPFLSFLKNSFLVSAFIVLGQTLSSLCAAYGFARIKFYGKNVWFMILLLTMMVPYQIIMIPLFIFFREVHLLDSLIPIILPQMFGGAFAIFLMRQFILTLPKELDEAAMIDGCNRFQILWKIILPLCKPALIVIGIFAFCNAWRDLLSPLIFIDSLDKRTVAQGLTYYLNPYHNDWHLLMAASIVALVPVAIIFFLFQKYLMKGVSMMGVKKG